jgi:hypothetical protein
MDHISIKAYLCVYCHEQVEAYDSYDGRPHYHDGKDWPVHEIELTAENFDGSLSEVLDQKREEYELELKKADRRTKRERAKYERRVREWEASATPEQLKAWEKSKAREKRTAEAFSSIMKDAMKDLKEDLNRTSYLLFGDDPRTQEEKDEAHRKYLTDQIQRHRDTIRRFHEEGLASVSFYSLDRAEEQLKEAEAELKELQRR